MPENQPSYERNSRLLKFRFFLLKKGNFRENLILCLLGKKQMNKKFFFQHFIRYSLSCEIFFSISVGEELETGKQLRKQYLTRYINC